MFCKHDWKQLLKTYSPPVNVECKRLSDTIMLSILHGVTEILWECAKCQAIRKERLFGKEYR